MLLRRAVIVSVSAAVALIACGGAPVKPDVPGSGPASGADAGAPQAKAEKEPGAQTPPGKTAADHHREFMAGCAKKAMNSPDYCECAWGEFRKVFTDDEMSAGDMPAAKLEKVKTQVVGACASKIPEEAVKDGFSKSCVGKNPEMKTYCDCTWSEFRKRFSAAELGDEGTVTSERFVTARGPVVKACGNKMPESVSKDAFMKGCAKDSAADKFCGCAWKELRKQASPGEIEAGTFDQKTVFAQVEKSCGKLRPPKP
ncbi:MAG: hypothetical protein JWP87_304 [Labilithrix sp.]|nr:hypothetical protein [Labilithrix sp.]